MWIARIKEARANDPRRSAAAIARDLGQYAARVGRDDAPSERTVRRIIEDLGDEDLSGYVYFSWPDSMQATGLGWDASAAFLELVGHYQLNEHGERPTSRLARWFAIVTLAAPGAPFEWRRPIAGVLAAGEIASIPEAKPWAEAVLAQRAWLDAAEGSYYAARHSDPGIPPLALSEWLSARDPQDESIRAAFWDAFGVTGTLPEALRVDLETRSGWVGEEGEAG